MNQGNNRDSGYGSDRDDDRNSSDTPRRDSWPHGGQRQQQADSGGWLSSQRQPGGSDSNWQGAARQQGGGSDWDAGQREGRSSEREQWGDWHQGQRGREAWDEGGRENMYGRESGQDAQRGRQGGWEGRPRGQGPERNRGEAPWGSEGGGQQRPDMRTHYRGGYGVSDYGSDFDRDTLVSSRDEARSQQGFARGGPNGGPSGGFSGGYRGGMQESRGGQGQNGLGQHYSGRGDDERAYEQFTGANERNRLSSSGYGGYEGQQRTYRGESNRGDRGAGGLATTRQQRVAPKGYIRSDERIREDLCERLTHSGRLDVHDVEVNVASGVVTLTGTVPDRMQKYRIEDMADDVFGVKEVQNELRVQRETQGQGNRLEAGSSGTKPAAGTGTQPGQSGQPGTSTPTKSSI